MRKLILPLLLLLLSALLPAAEVKSYAELSGGFTLMHITSAADELPLRSAMSAELRVAPLLVGDDTVKSGAYLNALIETPTPVHNGIRYDGNLRVGAGILITYSFTPLLTTEASLGTSIGWYLMAEGLIAAIDTSLALRITPVSLLAIVPRLTLSAESGRIETAFHIGAALEIGWW